MERHARRERVFADARLKAKAIDAEASNDNGWIEGYLAVFGNVDQGGERIVKGAFSKSIRERVPAGKVPLMVSHFMYGGDTNEVIGTITEAREDDYGLWIHAELSSVQLAQDTRQKVLEGHVKGLSVGYSLIRWEEKKDGDSYVMDLLECKLLEGTVTVKPMNESAVITAAKAVSDAARAVGAPGDGRLTPESLVGVGEAARALARSVDALLEDEAPETTGKTVAAVAPAGFHAMALEVAGNELYLQSAKLEC